MSFFWPRVPPTIPHHIWLACVFSPLYAVTVSQTSLVFGDLGSFVESQSGILQNVLQLEFISCLSHDWTGVMVSGRKTTEAKCPSHHIISRPPATTVTYPDDVGPHHLADEEFARLLSEAPFPPFSVLLEMSH